jgi:chromosome segregation ATPase
MTNEIRTLTQHVNDEKTRVNEIETTLNETNVKLTETENARVTLSKDLEASKSTLNEMEKQLKLMTNDNSNLNATIATKEDLLVKKEAEFAKMTKCVNDSNSEKETLQEELSKTKTAADVLKGECETLKTQIVDINKHMESLKQESQMQSGELQKRLSDEKEKVIFIFRLDFYFHNILLKFNTFHFLFTVIHRTATKQDRIEQGAIRT